MSIKNLLGLNKAGISNEEIIAKVREAQRKNLDFVEINVDGDIVKIGLPHISFDPNSDQDSW